MRSVGFYCDECGSLTGDHVKGCSMDKHDTPKCPSRSEIERAIYTCNRNAQEWKDKGDPESLEEARQWLDQGLLLGVLARFLRSEKGAGLRSDAASHGVLPECMIPDGAEPCAAYQHLEKELESARSAIVSTTELKEFIASLKIGHYYCEDSWYSCPKAEHGCANEAEGSECNCGANKWNARIDSMLDRLDR